MSAISRTRSNRTSVAVRPRTESTTVTLTITLLATTVMLEAMRVLVSYLVVVVGQANRTALIRDTLAVFAAIIAAPLLIRVAGLKSAVVLTAASMAVTRVVLQFWTQPTARLMMAAALVVLWGWLLIGLIGLSRQAVGLGLMAGLVLDVAVRGAFLTLDLPWNSGVAAGVTTVAISTLLLLSLIPMRTMTGQRESARGFSLSLFAVGPGLAMFHLVSGNLGLIQSKTGLDYADSLGIAAIGLAAGMTGAALFAQDVDRRPTWLRLLAHLVVIAIGGGALWLFWTDESLAPVALPFVVAANLVLTGTSIWSGCRKVDRTDSVLPTTWLTLGMLFQVGLLFYYYDASGRPLYLVAAAGALSIGALLGSLIASRQDRKLAVSAPYTSIVVAPMVVLALVSAWQFFESSSPSVGPPLPAAFTVMTYNLQDGFAADNSFDLEAQADIIAQAHPDVVVLQEVSRGWLVTSGADEALWLSHRLNMPIYFGGNSDDGLWGNAILTRAPIEDVRQYHFTVTQNLKRGAIETLVTTETGSFWVVGTHLDNPKNADVIRLQQAQQLVSRLTGKQPAMVLGDFNADPGTDVLKMFGNAGLSDPGSTFLANVTTTTDERRLDYILVSDGFKVDSMSAPDSWASDHKPVVATLTLVPRLAGVSSPTSTERGLTAFSRR